MSGRHPISQKFLSDTSGDDWRRIREIVSPTFTTGKISKTYAHCLRDYAQHLDSACAENNAQLDVLTSMGAYAMDLIARVTLDIDIDAYNSQRVSPFVTMANKAVESGLVKNLSRLIFPKWILWGTGDQSARDFFVNTVREVMANRRQMDDKRNDFMKLLMDAELPMDRADSAVTTDCEYGDQGGHVSGGRVSLHSVYLTFLTYELALNPSVQQRLYLELMDAIDPDTGDIPYDRLPRLPYLDAVLSETLRLHTGQQVDIPIHAIHHCADFYPDPEHFNPNRFMPCNRHLVEPYTYLPFGAGPRNYIRFALLEVKAAVAHIVWRFRFYRTAHTEVPVRHKRSFRLTFPDSVC
ncbi:unnamed protein product, partial [Oppiella nova]